MGMGLNGVVCVQKELEVHLQRDFQWPENSCLLQVPTPLNSTGRTPQALAMSGPGDQLLMAAKFGQGLIKTEC